MSRFRFLPLLAIGLMFATGCSLHRRKYENPIKADTEQPDKILFDKAVNDLEHGRYQVARLTLNTLMNTYDNSEFLAKAKLAIADSWMREGSTTALAQAEAEYKDFELFYPNMEEAAEAQEKICKIHYRQMEKADRDKHQAERAEDECRNVILQYPNSKFAPEATQMMRNIQEVLAEGEFAVGSFYFSKGSFPSASNRMDNLVNTYPLSSKADEALWVSAQGFLSPKMPAKFRSKGITDLQRLVRDYPLSIHVDEAKQQLTKLEADIPDPDPEQAARMKYEKDNYKKPSRVSNALNTFSRSPDVSNAAKQGTPTMQPLRPSIPVSIPTPEEIAKAQEAQRNGAPVPAAAGSNDVGVGVITGPSALDTQPDARGRTPAAPEAKPPAK